MTDLDADDRRMAVLWGRMFRIFCDRLGHAENIAAVLKLNDPQSIEPDASSMPDVHLVSITFEPDGLEPPIRTLVADLIAAPSAPGAAA